MPIEDIVFIVGLIGLVCLCLPVEEMVITLIETLK